MARETLNEKCTLATCIFITVRPILCLTVSSLRTCIAHCGVSVFHSGRFHVSLQPFSCLTELVYGLLWPYLCFISAV